MKFRMVPWFHFHGLVSCVSLLHFPHQLFVGHLFNSFCTPVYHLALYFCIFKGILHFFLEIGSFYNSPRVNQLSFTIFESIQLII